MATINELVKSMMCNSDTTPEIIDTETATTWIGWMYPDGNIPEDTTPEAFTEIWNDLVRESMQTC